MATDLQHAAGAYSKMTRQYGEDAPQTAKAEREMRILQAQYKIEQAMTLAPFTRAELHRLAGHAARVASR